jgi:lysylphosphatidylglycerol synthetase-like protein (DUF2156 family)
MDANDQRSSRIGELRASARGWHGVQLAVLGFIGLCGVLQKNAGSSKPDWLQALAGLLALVAFAVACVATVLVALAAWPVYAAHPGTQDEESEVAGTSRRLRTGITLTYVAVAVLALAASSGWWPAGSGGSQAGSAVEVNTRAGALCGALAAPSQPGTLAVSSQGRVVELALSDVESLKPVESC